MGPMNNCHPLLQQKGAKRNTMNYQKLTFRTVYNAVNKTDFMAVELLLMGVQGSTSTITLQKPLNNADSGLSAAHLSDPTGRKSRPC